MNGSESSEIGGAQCAICGESADYGEELLGVTMGDYVDTNLGEKPPVRRFFLCAHHTDSIISESERMSWEDSVL